jgi:hypothetical protein
MTGQKKATIPVSPYEYLPERNTDLVVHVKLWLVKGRQHSREIRAVCARIVQEMIGPVEKR